LVPGFFASDRVVGRGAVWQTPGDASWVAFDVSRARRGGRVADRSHWLRVALGTRVAAKARKTTRAQVSVNVHRHARQHAVNARERA